MRLNTTTDYALRIVKCLAEAENSINATELSQMTSVPRPYITIFMKKLRENDIVEAIRGAKGGYRLKSKAEDITVYDIMSAIEGTEIKGAFDDKDDSYEKINAVYEELQEAVDKVLKGTTVADLRH